MLLYKDGIVRDTNEDRVEGMKKKGWMELGDDGKPIPYGKSDENEILKEENKKLKEELDALKNKNEDPLKTMSVEELKDYAEANGIDIGGATTQKGIYDKIKAFENAQK